jgi:Caspase domain
MAPEFPAFPKKWAVLVGVNQYEHVSHLQFCKKDALDLEETFRASLGFEKDDILTFVEDSDRLPQRATILHHLGMIKERGSVGKDDLLVFFFSGHGMIDTNDGKDYLLPIEASPYNLSDTGLLIERIASELKDTGCNNIVMFIDACRELVASAKSVTSLGEGSVDALKRAGIVTFFSCSPKDRSYEIEELKRGSFTHCILEAINSGKGKTVSSLYEFLKAQVPVVNDNYKKPPQLPYLVIEPDEKRNLPLFFSIIKQQQAQADFDQLLDRIYDLCVGEKLQDKYVNIVTELLIKYQNDPTADQATPEFILIKKLCAGSLEPATFERMWEMREKRKVIPATAQTKLAPIL